MNYLLYLLGPTFLDGLVLAVYPFRAPPDCKGKKWFKAQYGKDFVEECEVLSLKLLRAVSENSSITTFVSMRKNGHRLLKSANLPDSHRDCNHPHSAIQWGIDLDMALRLDRMASLVTGVEIRSSENHYNHHRDEYDAITSCRYGGTNMTQLQKDKRIEFAYGGPNMTQLQRDKRLGGPDMSQLQKEGRRIGGVIGGSKPSVRQIITSDMFAGKCSGCGRLFQFFKPNTYLKFCPTDVARGKSAAVPLPLEESDFGKAEAELGELCRKRFFAFSSDASVLGCCLVAISPGYSMWYAISLNGRFTSNFCLLFSQR
jgi:hypothetical protein